MRTKKLDKCLLEENKTYQGVKLNCNIISINTDTDKGNRDTVLHCITESLYITMDRVMYKPCDRILLLLGSRGTDNLAWSLSEVYW